MVNKLASGSTQRSNAPAPSTSPGGEPVIEVRDLRKSYAGRPAVDDVSFAVHRGEIFGVLGPNGAGKTTTVEAVAGLRTPDSGRVRVLGLDPQEGHDTLVRRVGVQLQESALPDALTVAEALDLYACFYDRPADVDRLLEDWGVRPKARTRFKHLSGGQRQRLFIALALVGNPEVVILDELTTGLDPQGRRDTWKLVEDIRAAGITVLLVTHFMDEAENLCDRIAIIDAGRVVATGAPSELIAAATSTQTLRFVAPEGVDPSAVAAMPDVTDVRRLGEELVVTGRDDVLLSVVTGLADLGVRPRRLRTEQAGLEDAYLQLTGHAYDADATTTEPDRPKGR